MITHHKNAQKMMSKDGDKRYNLHKHHDKRINIFEFSLPKAST